MSAIRQFLFWCLITAALWSDAQWLLPLAGVLLVWHLLARRFGAAEKSSDELLNALQSEHYNERERGLLEGAELATPAAHRALLSHLEKTAGTEGSEELLGTARALVRGWGLETLIDGWDQLSAPVRMRLLEALQDAQGFERMDVLKLARRGMQDGDVAIARRGWRTYAYSVTFAVERQLADFDFPAWYAQSADDSHEELQVLRTSLEKKRLAEADTQGVDVMVARYRREVFKVFPAREVCLGVSKDCQVSFEGGDDFLLHAGLYTGTLTGLFDNAQDAIADGWQVRFEGLNSQGEKLGLDYAWEASVLFGEILSASHDDQRCWLESAPEEIIRAFALQPVVGPAVAWTDELDEVHPQVEGEALDLEPTQLLSCLIAQIPKGVGAGGELAFLLYETTDAEDNEIRPFVTVMDLEVLLLGLSSRD
jgi:hypothetical protein